MERSLDVLSHDSFSTFSVRKGCSGRLNVFGPQNAVTTVTCHIKILTVVMGHHLGLKDSILFSFFNCYSRREEMQLLRRITQVFWSSFQQEFLSMSSEFTFGDNSDKLSIFQFLFEFG